MAEEQNQDAAEGEEKKGSPIVMIAAVSVLAIAAGIGTPFLLGSFSSAPQEEDPTEITPAAMEFDFVEFDEVVVNLNEQRLTRYLRLKISLQIEKSKKDEIAKSLEENKMILRDWLNGYVADQKMDSIRGRAGQNRMRREIKDHFNSVLFPNGFEHIHGVLFLEFNVQ